VVPHDTFHHSAVVYQGSMYVFGGYRCSHNSLLEYRFGTETWSVVNTTGTTPSPRWGHRALVYKNSMFMFGGRDAVGNTSDLYELNFGMSQQPQIIGYRSPTNQPWISIDCTCGADTLEWKKRESTGIAARFFASMVVHDHSLLVFGGRNIYTFDFNDLLAYDLEHNNRSSTLISDMRSILNSPALADVRFHFPEEQKVCSSSSNSKQVSQWALAW
jgi:hypothetical protein